MECRSGGETHGLVLRRVLSASLDPKKSWFALNSALCSGKPFRFCSLGYARPRDETQDEASSIACV